jgi:hypothetical protein
LAALQVIGTHPGLTQIPELHCWPAPQPAQVSARPQPSPIIPQYSPQVRAIQLGPPTHRPSSHISPSGQAPHSTDSPGQPFPMRPQ